MFYVYAKAKDKKGKTRTFHKSANTKSGAEVKAASHMIDKCWTHFEIVTIRQTVKNLHTEENQFRVL
tara:strand:- start:2393 stop:2593 length:201 start_codon:yes stop_codon:yes gene_type:complete